MRHIDTTTFRGDEEWKTEGGVCGYGSEGGAGLDSFFAVFLSTLRKWLYMTTPPWLASFGLEKRCVLSFFGSGVEEEGQFR